MLVLVELLFVNLPTEVRGDYVALSLGEFPIPHLVERSGDVSVAGSSTAHLDIREVRPIDFNLHAFSLQAEPRTVNIFHAIYFKNLWVINGQ